MSTTFLTSDTHFGHRNICNFLRADGTPLRPWNDVEEMNESMILYWNRTVSPEDKVYHVGDVVINRRYLNQILPRLNGRKVLIKGNHDLFKMGDYVNHFKDIRGYHVLNNMLICHIPVHPGSKGRFNANIHGHLHAEVVRDHRGWVDPWYINVSVEQTNYTPISFDEVQAIAKERKLLPSSKG